RSRAARSRPGTVAMRAASGQQPAGEAEETGSDGRGEAARGGQPCERKKFVYVDPSRRVKEILQEELYLQKEEYHIKHPAAVALEGIWSLKKNFSIGGLKPESQNRNGLLLQPQFYSRHAAMRSKSQQ
uniref:Chromosome 11 open reading frame 97 n=1 Tax=Cairina moschata TaxID=8855 RepID=A0A8C3BZI8_CAIMO